MQRLTYALACMLIAALLVPAAALAAKPTRDPLPAPPTFTISGSCSFDVQVDVLRNKEFITGFSSGKTIVTGQLFLRLTNLSEPSKSVTLNVSGPGINDVSDPSTFNLSGTSLFWSTGLPVLLTRGPVSLTLDSAGNVTSFTQKSASSVNECAVLS
jgi:hypothetical protein